MRYEGNLLQERKYHLPSCSITAGRLIQHGRDARKLHFGMRVIQSEVGGETARVPASVQAVLAARIDRLLESDKRLLQSAAVIGKDVPFSLLEAVAELHGEALRDALARLREDEFLYETSVFPDLELTFKHALTHEVTYAGLVQERRRALHARVFDAIERVHVDRLVDQVE